MSPVQEQFNALVDDREATVGIVGLGYVGLPLAVEVARSGFKVVGLDKSEDVASLINRGESHIADVPGSVMKELVGAGKVRATSDASELGKCDVISICVPTPLSKIKDPDLSYVVAAAEAVQS